MLAARAVGGVAAKKLHKTKKNENDIPGASQKESYSPCRFRIDSYIGELNCRNRIEPIPFSKHK